MKDKQIIKKQEKIIEILERYFVTNPISNYSKCADEIIESLSQEPAQESQPESKDNVFLIHQTGNETRLYKNGIKVSPAEFTEFYGCEMTDEQKKILNLVKQNYINYLPQSQRSVSDEEIDYSELRKINTPCLKGISCNLCETVDKKSFNKCFEKYRPKIVCICGSGRFLKEMHEVEELLTLDGKIVLMIGVNTKDVARTHNLEHFKPMLDELHLRKIDLSDYVYVVNVAGYIGESTRKEIIYAESIKKPIEYLERETPGKIKPDEPMNHKYPPEEEYRKHGRAT